MFNYYFFPYMWIDQEIKMYPKNHNLKNSNEMADDRRGSNAITFLTVLSVFAQYNFFLNKHLFSSKPSIFYPGVMQLLFVKFWTLHVNKFLFFHN